MWPTSRGGYRKKEPDKDCFRFLKASNTTLPLLGYADRTWSSMKPEPPPPHRAIPTKRRRLAYETTTPAPIPSTSRDVVYETPTPQPLSVKRGIDDDDDYVSDDDLRVEPYVLD